MISSIIFLLFLVLKQVTWYFNKLLKNFPLPPRVFAHSDKRKARFFLAHNNLVVPVAPTMRIDHWKESCSHAVEKDSPKLTEIRLRNTPRRCTAVFQRVPRQFIPPPQDLCYRSVSLWVPVRFSHVFPRYIF